MAVPGNQSCHDNEQPGQGLLPARPEGAATFWVSSWMRPMDPEAPEAVLSETRSCSPPLDPTMARRFLKLLCNSCFSQAAAGISISTCFVFSLERKHECETVTPLSDQTTALPDCLGLLVGWRMYSEAPSGSQVQLPE